MTKSDDASPALRLLRTAWDGEGTATSGRSWRRLNGAMQDALELAIEAQVKFARDDFDAIYKQLRAGYWLHIEGAYGRAIEHGNLSAALAIEAHLKRKPFLVHTRLPGSGDGKVRLCVGSAFAWYDAFRVEVESSYAVRVTSFDDAAGSLVACAYQRPIADGQGNLPPGYAPEMVDGIRDDPTGGILPGYEIDVSQNPGRRAGSKVFRRWTITHADFMRREQAMKDYESGRAQWVAKMTAALSAAH